MYFLQGYCFRIVLAVRGPRVLNRAYVMFSKVDEVTHERGEQYRADFP